MKTISLFLLGTLLATAALAQKVVYDDNVQKRTVGSFRAIETSTGIEVIISKGNKEELAVSADHPDYLPEVKTVVQGGVLKIYRSEDWKIWRQWKNWKIKVYVSFTKLEELEANSGSSIHGTDIHLEKLSATLSSGGFIELSGKVNMLNIDGSSGAQFYGYKLNTTTCNIEVSSGAGAQITVDKEISAKANSGGFIRYKGEGVIKDINVNSGGSVKRGR